MNSTKHITKELESNLRGISQKHLHSFRSKIQLKKENARLNEKLKLLSSTTEQLGKDVVNKSIEFIKKHKIKDNATVDKVVRLNHKYIFEFKNLIGI